MFSFRKIALKNKQNYILYDVHTIFIKFRGDTMGRVDVNPKMMKWAREYAGYSGEYESLLPKYIKSHYLDWEKGTKKPTWNQLMKVSSKYKVPTAFFFIDEYPIVEDYTEKLVNYRKIDVNVPNVESPSLLYNIRQVEFNRETYMELCDDTNKKLITFKNFFFSKSNQIDFSRYIRSILDFNLDSQKELYSDSNHYSFLNHWKNLLNEKLGILIFESQNVDILEMRALCLYHDEIPIILLNGKDSVNGRIFSLFHELTHLIMHESAVCDIYLDHELEVFCNAVAGEFLVPSNDFKGELSGFSNYLGNSCLNKLANTYGVSKYVILRRLLDLGKIEQKDYDIKINEFMNNSVKYHSHGGNYLNNQIKYNGKQYLEVLLNAYDLGVITEFEFSQIANIKQKFIPELETKIFGEE